ncbi:hypothetical protein BC830DRAFT_87758 [Chytriomyces sp. MP71]|nr:hypothetical protein BC830DRAFT_87758 [Chytriomyces sp. MP71]
MFKKVFMEMGRSPSTCSSLLIADRAKSAHSLTSRLLSSSSVSYSHSSMTDMATISSSMIHESARTLHSQVPSTWSVAKRIQLNRGMRGSKCVLSAHVAFIAHGNGITVSLLSYNIQSFPWVKNRGQRVMRRISAKINTRTLHFTYFPYLSAPASNRPSTSLLPQHEYCHADFSKKSMCGESSSIFPTSLPKLCDNSNRTVPKECCQHSPLLQLELRGVIH